MEQLISKRGVQPCPSSLGRLMEVQMLMRKVKIKLSKEQIYALISLMQVFLSRYPITGLKDKSIYLRVLQLFEKRIRFKQFNSKSTSITLDVYTAEALFQMAYWLQHYDFQPYEKNLIRHLIDEIHHQTI